MLNYNPPIAEVIRFCQTRSKKLLLLLLVAAATPALAQDFYVITAGSNYLAHTDATTIGNPTSFNANTCLWTISGNNIVAIAPDGTTGNTLGYTASTNWQGNINGVNGLQFAASPAYTAWDNVTSSPSISYSSGGWGGGTTTVYLRYRNNAWGVSDNNTHATVTKVDVSDAPNTSSSSTTSYTATLDGDGVIYSTSGTHTYTVDINQVVTYAQTRRTFGTLGTVTVNVPYTASSAYTGAVSNVQWSVSDNTYGATITSGGVLSVTSLPASVDNLTVTYTAQAGGQPVSGTMTVTLMSAATYADAVDGGTTGVSVTTVTLNDYEDHSWSYYNKEDNSPIRSWNPANVKITYNGNGTGTVQTNNNDTPSTWGADANTVKVGIDADANKFVYYKTLERTDGRTAANPTGRCAYTTIANPFAVRPTYDSDGTSKYRGFYAWRVKTLSGGTIHSAATGGTSYAVGSTINAETEIYFAPSGEYGMTVEFEALWARAYVSTTGAGNHNLGVERNFYVITTSANSNITAGDYPCTYTSIYPNGTTNGTTAATSVTVYKYGGFTAAADSKIEYIILRNNNSTINAAGHNFTIGRGVSGYNGGLCATNLYGLNADATTDFRFNFASGRFTNLYFCGDGNNMTGKLTSVIGCDYDRVMGDNSKLKVTADIIAGHNGNGGSNGNEGDDFLVCTVRSGDFDLGNYGGGVQFYLSLWGNSGSGTYGKKTMIVEGGVFSDISGGIDVEDNQVAAADMVEIRVKGGTINGALYGAAQYAGAYGNRRIVITGGDLKGWVAGGANGTETTRGKLTGNTHIYFGGDARCDSDGSNTTIGNGEATGGNIFGAGSGNSAAGADATVGEVNNSTIVIADECYVERNVYGGGNYGYVVAGTGHKSDIHVMGGTVNGKVFGGSNQQKGQIVNINMTGGTVIGGIHGGSNTTGTVAGPVTMQIDGGQVGAADAAGQRGNIHGGGYGQNTSVSGDISINLGSCGQTTAGVTVYGDVYGGSALGTVNTNDDNTTTVSLYKGTIVGGLYGGGLGSNTVAAAVRGKVRVAVAGGSVVCASDDQQGVAGSGSVFGCNNVNGAPASDVRVDIYRTDTPATPGSYALHAVYGGGNKAAYGRTPVVAIHGCSNSIEYVYGGGNATNVAGTDVTIWGGTIHYAFGGGNGAGDGNPGANITSGGTHLTIHGGTIDAAFGGSNERGTITGGITVDVKAQQEDGNDTCGNAYSSCPLGMDITELYGGGNKAEITTAPEMNLDCSANVHKLFGGAREANFTGDIQLEVFGGTYQQIFGGNNINGIINGDVSVIMHGGDAGEVFGGNNLGGEITGTITVTIDSNLSKCGNFEVDDVYGGGNQAPYSHTTGNYPQVNIKNGTVRNNVFGGGLGAAAKVDGSPIVTLGGENGAATGTGTVVNVFGNVYGGGNEAEVEGTTQVVMFKGLVGKPSESDPEKGNIFGGGKGKDSDLSAGKITGNTQVVLKGGTVEHNVYGGGHLGQVTGNTDVQLTQP